MNYFTNGAPYSLSARSVCPQRPRWRHSLLPLPLHHCTDHPSRPSFLARLSLRSTRAGLCLTHSVLSVSHSLTHSVLALSTSLSVVSPAPLKKPLTWRYDTIGVLFFTRGFFSPALSHSAIGFFHRTGNSLTKTRDKEKLGN